MPPDQRSWTLRCYSGGALIVADGPDVPPGESVWVVEAALTPAGMLDEFESHPNAMEKPPLSLWHELFREEAKELRRALEFEGPEQVARECADVVYVVYGIARRYGIDLDAALQEVHAAAMRKMEANVRRSDGKIVKPPGFVPPDMTRALAGFRVDEKGDEGE